MKKLCNHPGCRAVFSGSGFLCSEHRNRNRNPSDIQKHNKENQKFYRTKRWITVRRIHISDYPICEYCNRSLAIQVDHFLEYDLDAEREFIVDDQNLVSTCLSCHITKGNHIRKLIKKGCTNEIRNWLIANHPRTDCVDYLKTASISLQSSGETI